MNIPQVRDRLTTLRDAALSARAGQDHSRTEKACLKATADAYQTALDLLAEITTVRSLDYPGRDEYHVPGIYHSWDRRTA